MKRTCLLTLLLTGLSWALLPPAAHAVSSCGDYIQILKSCQDSVIGTYGQKIIVEKREGGKLTRRSVPCTKGKDVRKTCGTGNFCIKAPGAAFSFCYKGGGIYNQYKALVGEANNLCEPIFVSRQGGSSGYLTCVQNAKCDMNKINACRTTLKKEKKTGSGGAIVGLLLFLLATLLLEGLLIFATIKIVDKHNPRNTIVRAVVLSVIIGLFTFPLVYSSPLLGMLLSGSLLFGLIIVFYQQEAFLPALFTAFHILWVSAFFTYTVAAEQLGNDAWLAQPKTLRFRLVDRHGQLNEDIEEFEREQASRKLAAADAKKTAKANKKDDDKDDDKKDKDKKDK